MTSGSVDEGGSRESRPLGSPSGRPLANGGRFHPSSWRVGATREREQPRGWAWTVGCRRLRGWAASLAAGHACVHSPVLEAQQRRPPPQSSPSPARTSSCEAEGRRRAQRHHRSDAVRTRRQPPGLGALHASPSMAAVHDGAARRCQSPFHGRRPSRQPRSLRTPGRCAIVTAICTTRPLGGASHPFQPQRPQPWNLPTAGHPVLSHPRPQPRVRPTARLPVRPPSLRRPYARRALAVVARSTPIAQAPWPPHPGKPSPRARRLALINQTLHGPSSAASQLPARSR